MKQAWLLINIRNKLATVLVILWRRRRRRQKTKAKTKRKFWISPLNANVPYLGHIIVHFCWWWWWWWIVFVVWLTDERRLASFPAATIVRDLHHCKYPTLQISELEFSFYWKKLCSSDNHYTMAPQNDRWLGKIILLHFSSIPVCLRNCSIIS